jgi:hypothetical protein
MIKASASMTLVRVNDGEDGQGIRSITPEYYLSDSSTQMPDSDSDGWKSVPDDYIDKHYYWVRSKILWDDGTYTTTTPVLANDLKSIIDDYDNRINNMNNQLQQATKDASSSIEQTKTSILQTVSENYYSASDGKNLASTVSTIQQTTESIQMGFVKKEDFTSLSDKVSNNQNQLNTYIRFNAEGIEIGKQDSEFKTKQTNSKYSILQNNDEVAYFANNRMYNSNIEVSSSLRIGNFGFIVNSDGSLTFKKVGGD